MTAMVIVWSKKANVGPLPVPALVQGKVLFWPPKKQVFFCKAAAELCSNNSWKSEVTWVKEKESYIKFQFCFFWAMWTAQVPLPPLTQPPPAQNGAEFLFAGCSKAWMRQWLQCFQISTWNTTGMWENASDGSGLCWEHLAVFLVVSLWGLCSSLPGLQTTEDAKFYALSTRFKPFSNENETLVVQFSVKHEQGIDCGGGYVKLFPATLNQEDMHSESEYYIMFGKNSDSHWQSCQVLVRATALVEKF